LALNGEEAKLGRDWRTTYAEGGQRRRQQSRAVDAVLSMHKAILELLSL